MEDQGEDDFLHIFSTLREMYQELHKKGNGLKHSSLIFQRDTFLEMLITEIFKEDDGEVDLDDFTFYQQLEQRVNKEPSNWKVTI